METNLRQALANRQITLEVVALMSTGMTGREALEAVCGAEVVDQMIDNLYHELRRRAGVE